MTDQTRQVALPAYLRKRMQAFRVVRGEKTTYLLRDKLSDKTHDLQQWQFFVMEVLPGCETMDKLRSVFNDRFNSDISEKEVLAFFAQLADDKLLDKDAENHPLLKPFTTRTYVLEKGLVKPKSFDELITKLTLESTAAGKQANVPAEPGAPAAAPAGPAAPVPPPAAPAAPAVAAVAADDLPAGINEADALDPRQSKLLLPFFPFAPVMRVLLPVLEPLKFGIYILPVVILAALMIGVRHAPLVWEDLSKLRDTTSLVSHALFSLFTINIVIVFTQGLVAQKFRCSVGHFGLGLRFGFFPRFMAPVGHTKQLSRRERMWIQGAPLLMRMTLFSIGVLLWYNMRDSHALLADIGLGLAFMSAVNLVIEGGNPLVKGNAYHLLAAFTNEPQLRGRSYKAFMDVIRGTGRAGDSGREILAAYALASFIYAYIVVLLIVLVAGHFLIYELRIGGVGLAAVLALGVYLGVRTTARFKSITQAYERNQNFERWRQRALPSEGGETVQVEPSGSRAWRYTRRALLIAGLLLLFLPYPYDAGGDFTIFPAERQVITSDISGIIEQVNFDGGETVKAGTVVARIAATDLTAQIAVIDARVAEQQAVIADLKARPKPEEVVVAQRELETAQKRSQFSTAKVPRYERLYKERAISFEELDAARKEAEVDVREVAQRAAALALVKTGTPKDRIAAEEAKLAALGQQRAEVEGRAARTVLKMPFDGNLLTLHLKQKLNSVLDKGQPFATVESINSVTAEIEVPESDIAYVKVGAPVRVRPNAFYERVFEGKVRNIDRNVTAKSFGKVVKVIADVENPKGELRTGMTGYAKVTYGEMPVWKAFTTALVRFFTVQVWSWLP